MKLYHYSTEPLKILLTRREQGVSDEQISEAETKAKKLGLPLPYIDHISFFLEPIPKETIAGIFKNQHPFWKAGAEIYEHVIDTASIPSQSQYMVVETPVIDKYTDQFDWSVTDLTVRSKYFIAMHKEMKRLGLLGAGIPKMVKQLTPYLGKTEGYYIKARMAKGADMTKTQYAAGVPHLMVYPIGGRVKVEQVSKIKLGSTQPTISNLIYHLSFNEALPTLLKPRQPSDSGDDSSKFVEKLPPRVSFSPTIQQCFAAIYPNISHYFEEHNYPHMDMYVYCPVQWGKQIPPDTILEKVWDSHITGEVCYQDSVRVLKVAKIRIYREGDQVIRGQPFDNPFMKPQFISPIIRFEVLKHIENTPII